MGTMGKYTKWITGGLILYTGAAAGTFLYLRPKDHELPCPCPQVKHDKRRSPYDAVADKYDSIIGFDEIVMGIRTLRWWYIRKISKGNVLEVSAGTGRNLPFYDLSTVNSVTLSDISRDMLWHAREKFGQMKEAQPSCAGAKVKFCLADAEHLSYGNPVPLWKLKDTPVEEREYSVNSADAPLVAFRPMTFDTVVDTFGLCSMEDPVAALKEMARVCKPSGQLMLMEHGRSSWDWLNRWLDDSAQQHFVKWGCWWNRDILRLCHEAGLEVESVKRYHFGMSLLSIIGCVSNGLNKKKIITFVQQMRLMQ